MESGARRARDLALLDAIDAFKRQPFEEPVWRVCRDERDPVAGAASKSRWCDSGFDVLYTSLARDGALAEIHALLSLQPVFPSKIVTLVHRLAVDATATLRLADLKTLAGLGVDATRYAERDYAKTQAIADAAYFLGFDGLIAPSARWDCLNIALFTDQLSPGAVSVIETEQDPVDWKAWRDSNRR